MAKATKHRALLGDLLIAGGIITEGQLAAALAAQGQSRPQRLIGEIIVDLGYATKEQVLSAVAEGCGVPFARLTPQLVDPAIRGSLPETFIQKHGVLPLFRVRDMLTVAVSEPANLFLMDEIAHAAGLSVQVVAATADNIYEMMEYTLAGAKDEARAETLAEDALAGEEVLLANDYDSVYGNWPPEKVAALLLREAVRARAGAIHLEPDEKVLRVRFGIDGCLHVVMRPPARLAAGLTDAFEAMVGASARPTSGHPGTAASRAVAGDTPAVPERDGSNLGRSKRLMVEGRAVQLHMTSLGGAFGPRVVIRLVRDDEAQRPLEKLGCDFDLLTKYRELIAPLRGLVLVAGPRSSGVTTTLYSTLNDLDPIRLNICTFENSVSFSLPGVNQFTPATCGLADSASALRLLLHQQVDVLALDCEMPRAVARVTVEAALDGCLVLAQVRAGDAADAVARMLSVASPEDLATALRGVLAQRLVRTICPHCRTTYEPPAHLRRRIAETFGQVEQYAAGRGCGNCGRTGLLGQIGLFELVTVEGALADRIRARTGREAMRDAIRAAGFPSLWVDGINKTRAGITSLEEVMSVLSGCPGEAPPTAPKATDH